MTLSDKTTAIAAILTSLVVLLGWLRWVHPRWKALCMKVGGIFDAILGREAIVDRITGNELVPAQPGVGVRLAHQEQQMETLTTAVATLVNHQRNQQVLEGRVDSLEHRTKALEDAAVERVVSHVESAQMFQAMDTAIKAQPPTD